MKRLSKKSKFLSDGDPSAIRQQLPTDLISSIFFVCTLVLHTCKKNSIMVRTDYQQSAKEIVISRYFSASFSLKQSQDGADRIRE